MNPLGGQVDLRGVYNGAGGLLIGGLEMLTSPVGYHPVGPAGQGRTRLGLGCGVVRGVAEFRRSLICLGACIRPD